MPHVNLRVNFETSSLSLRIRQTQGAMRKGIPLAVADVYRNALRRRRFWAFTRHVDLIQYELG